MNIDQYTFIRTRRKLLKSWSAVGITAIILVALTFAWISLSSPIFVNPFDAIKKVQEGVLQQSTLEMIAIFLPIIVITLFLSMVVIIAMIYQSLSNEKKYIKIIQCLMK